MNQAQLTHSPKKIVQATSGVLLWIYLVVKSLLAGLTNGETFDDLQKRLQELPPELDSLYGAILRSINPPFCREQVSGLLQIVYQSREPMSSFALSLADDPNPSLAINAEISSYTQAQIDARIDSLTRRLKSRCKGLIEVHIFKNGNSGPPTIVDIPTRPGQVRYLHLTVKEFLEKPEVWSELLSWTFATNFDSNVACLKGLILRLKSTFAYHRWGRHIISLIDSAISFARYAESSSSQSHVSLVDELDKTATALYGPTNEHWSIESMMQWEDYRYAETRIPWSRAWHSQEPSFLIHSIVRGLALYLGANIGSKLLSLDQESPIPLLDYATGASGELKYLSTITPFHMKSITDSHTLSYNDLNVRPLPSMITMLLHVGLNPNTMRSNTSPWTSFMEIVQSRIASKGTIPLNWIDTCKLFLIYSADIAAPISAEKSESCGSVLRFILPTVPTTAAVELEQLILERTATQAEAREHSLYNNSARSKSQRAGQRGSRKRRRTQYMRPTGGGKRRQN
ncbi:MAG: hypothetical protein M1820_008498 [Bogoriella megaspora]|nr:MAG: hypothetical protein M1820_008498 [Bogoriella megaspora]